MSCPNTTFTTDELEYFAIGLRRILVHDVSINSVDDAQRFKKHILGATSETLARSRYGEYFDGNNAPFLPEIYHQALSDPFIQSFITYLDSFMNDMTVKQRERWNASINDKVKEWATIQWRTANKIREQIDQLSAMWKAICRRYGFSTREFHSLLYHKPTTGSYKDIVDTITSISDGLIASSFDISYPFVKNMSNGDPLFESHLFSFDGYPVLLEVDDIYETQTFDYRLSKLTGSVDFCLHTVDDGIFVLTKRLAATRLPTKPLKPKAIGNIVLNDGNTYNANLVGRLSMKQIVTILSFMKEYKMV